ncbi:unnamed protein product [Dibothriocephalus latus]|uniref:Zinc finger CCCH domain-containing protein 14 n=1 Tax=Dibothriocephalus latus TaxID=60516 RepID=A0A3P7L1C4_DIBLA|nr:unnamed protein product [Dibothriocephalus latus]
MKTLNLANLGSQCDYYRYCIVLDSQFYLPFFPLTAKLRDLQMREVGLVKSKLKELGAFVDEELPDYIMVMVANKKKRESMNNDLQLFLGAQTEHFTEWLHSVLESYLKPEDKKKRTPSIPNSKEEKRVAKRQAKTNRVEAKYSKSRSRSRSPVSQKTSQRTSVESEVDVISVRTDENEFIEETSSSVQKEAVPQTTTKPKEQRRIVSTSSLTGPSTDASGEAGPGLRPTSEDDIAPPAAKSTRFVVTLNESAVSAKGVSGAGGVSNVKSRLGPRITTSRLSVEADRDDALGSTLEMLDARDILIAKKLQKSKTTMSAELLSTNTNHMIAAEKPKDIAPMVISLNDTDEDELAETARLLKSPTKTGTVAKEQSAEPPKRENIPSPNVLIPVSTLQCFMARAFSSTSRICKGAFCFYTFIPV